MNKSVNAFKDQRIELRQTKLNRGPIAGDPHSSIQRSTSHRVRNNAIDNNVDFSATKKPWKWCKFVSNNENGLFVIKQQE